MNLDNEINQLKNATQKRIKTVRYDGYIFAVLMLLSILGVAITDASQQISHWYWLAMVPIFFGACLYLDWQSSAESSMPAKTIVLKQIEHWLGLLAGISITYYMRATGSFDNHTTGLIMLLLLSLTTFLAGSTVGWLFRLLGIFLALCLILVDYMEQYLSLIVGIAVLMLILHHFLTKPKTA